MTKQYWQGEPGLCDLDGQDFYGVMFDANVGGRWGNICQACFTKYGCTLGTGSGQKYEQQYDGRWLKVAG